MEFFNDLTEEQRIYVWSVFTGNRSTEQKFSLLEACCLDRTTLQKAKAFLRKGEDIDEVDAGIVSLIEAQEQVETNQQAETSTPTGIEIILDGFSTPAKRNLAEFLLQTRLYDPLVSVLLQETNETKHRFLNWFKQQEDFDETMIRSIVEELRAAESGSRTALREVLHLMSSDQKRVLLCLMIKTRQWKSCDALIGLESSETQMAFVRWKSQPPTIYPEEDDEYFAPPRPGEGNYNIEPKVKDTNIAPNEWSPTFGHDFFEKFPPEMNILVLGETGVGKSSFINGLANYLTFPNIHEAKENCSRVMDFLEDVPEQIRNTVLFFLQDKSLDAVTKLCMLRGMGLEESVIQKASDYLDARPEEAAEEEGEKSDNDIEFVDFRDFLSDNRRTVANLLVEQKKWPELAKYIAVESDEAQEAFEAFMRRVEKENGQDHQEPRARTSEHDEISTETVSAAGHSASEGMKQKEEENFQKTNITYETPSVDQTPPPSINLRPGSLDSQKKNDSIENTKTNDSNNAETIQLMEKQMRAEMMAEMERQKIEEVERLVAQRLAEERLAEMEAKQEQMEADELKRQKKMEEVERLVAQKFEEEKRQKELSEMEAKQEQMEADELKRQKKMEEVERLVAQKFEEEKRQKELSEMEAKQEQMEADELKRQKEMEEVERLVAQKFEEEKHQKELSEMEAKQEQMEADELKRQKEMEEVERLVAQRFEEEKRQKELSEMEAKQQMETEELERQKKMEEVERLVAQKFEEEKRQKELFEMEAKKQQMKTEELERQKKMEEAERLVTQRLEEEKRQKELSEMKAKQQMETEELERQKKMEEAAKLEAEKREAENVDFYRDDDEPELVKEREEVKPEIDKLTKLINSKAQFTQDFPKVMNVLVLGETGVGKTTWINAFLNYFKYNTMNQARANGVEVLIPTKFTQLDKDLRKTVVEYSPTISSPDDQNVNEDWRTGESSTQQPKAYAFRVGPEDDQKIIRIIDTPGIGDRRGIEHDKLNFEKILRFIADYPEIHAILILLKPNNAILNVVFRFCIFELLTHLHVSARKNIMFCFTNARQTLYSPGESMPALEQLMTDLQAKRGFRIPLEHKNVFCFDSESFRFLCAWGKGIRFSESEIADFAESWSISVEETFRLLDAIKELQPHQVQKTLSVNNVRSIVFALSRPIAEIFRNTEINRIKLEKKIIEVENLLEEKGNLAQLDLFVNQVSIHAKELDYPMTVCAGVNCTEKRKFTHRDEIERIVYKKECHTRCYLKGIKKGLFPNPLIKNCWCFGCGVHSERCSTCTCGWETHLHISYELVFTSEKVMDSRVKESLENNENKQKAAEMFVLTERKKLRDLEVLSKMLCEYCSEFAAFIHSNSLLPYNDVYLEYVDFLIREEDMKISNGASNSMRKRLIDHRQTYEQTVGHLLRAAANASPNQRSSKTTAEIMSMLEELKDLPKGGEFLREVERLEMLSVRQEQTNSVTNIKLRSPHFSNMM